MQNNTKQYGLIKLQKSNVSTKNLPQKASVFGDSSDDSDCNESSTKIPKFESSQTRKQAQIRISQAVELDPTIFEYDSVYDDMKSSSKSEKNKQTEKKSRYITNMLKNKDKRELENELREERKIQKEREKEGDEFKDKESFVTSAYKEKLEQLRRTQEDIRQQESVENILDVTKQTDLSGFYRSYYRNNLFSNEKPDEALSDDTEKVKFNKKSTSSNMKASLRERNLKTDDDDEEMEEVSILPKMTTKVDTKGVENITESTDKSPTPPKTEEIVSNEKENEQSPVSNAKIESTSSEKEKKSLEVLEEVKVPKKPVVDRAQLIRQMFSKRTIGEVYENARERYFERRALKQLRSV